MIHPKPHQTFLLFLTLTLMINNQINFVVSQDITEISEQELYVNIYQSKNSIKYYSVTINPDLFDGQAYLAFSVMADEYESDPDIFISSSVMYPNKPENSEYFCMKKGSDTCVLNPADINVGETFYFGIKCLSSCHYDLRLVYMFATPLEDDTTLTSALDGHTPDLFSYKIPYTSDDGFTNTVYITVKTESNYDPVEIYLSIDNELQQIEEKSDLLALSQGVGLVFTQYDYDFCTECSIYLLINVMNQGAYDIKATSSSNNLILRTNSTVDALVAQQQFTCYQYLVETSDSDVTFQINGLTGKAEVFLDLNLPTSLSDQNIAILTDRTDQRTILAHVDDLTQWENPGLIYICLYGLTYVSAQISVNEEPTANQIMANDGSTINMRLQDSGYSFLYTNKDIAELQTIEVKLKTTGLQSSQTMPKIIYKLCLSPEAASCTLSNSEINGNSASMKELNIDEVQTLNTQESTPEIRVMTGTLNHDPANCVSVFYCYYIFAVVSPGYDYPLPIALLFTHQEEERMSIGLKSAFQNVLPQGQYFYYSLYPSENLDMLYTKALVIDLTTYSGDADLYVSSDTMNPTVQDHEYSSTLHTNFDQIVINATQEADFLSFPINIGVYAFDRAAYGLVLTPIYTDQYDYQLMSALPTIDGSPNYMMIEDEADDYPVYTFTPWWDGSENRTIIFATEIVFNNKINMYASKDDQPGPFQYEWLSNKQSSNIIVIYPWDPEYEADNTYYIRVSPDFALFDLISLREYIFNFYAFSQPQNSETIELQINTNLTGFSNGMTTNYRHLVENPSGTYTITVSPLLGNPILLIGMGSSTRRIDIDNLGSYDYRINNPQSSISNVTQFNLTYELRQQNDANCQQSGYYLYGGTLNCGIFMGVYCDEICAYNISIVVKGEEWQMDIPKYLVEGQNENGKVVFSWNWRTVQHYYIPVGQDTGDLTLYLNKTGILGIENGDSFITVLVIDNPSLGYKRWGNQWQEEYNQISRSMDRFQPEIIQICGDTFKQKCTGLSCVVLVGVYANTKNLASYFQLKYLASANHLVSNEPRKGTIAVPNTYHYYYFTNNETVNNSSAVWEYVVSASAFNSSIGDVDLYISVIDGRYPTAVDYDFKSDNSGSDVIYINDEDPVFEEHKYLVSNGMVFIVGVRAVTPDVTYSLIMSGPKKFDFNFIDIITTSPKTGYLNNRIGKVQSYRWFNWGSGDTLIQVNSLRGQIYAFINTYSVNSHQDSIYLSIPQNQNNSLWSSSISALSSSQLRILKSDKNGLFCQYCWYFITVMSNSTSQTQYSVQVQNVADAGQTVLEASINIQYAITLAATGSVIQRKILFDNKAPFTFSLELFQGYVTCYIGMYPDSPMTQYYWTSQGGVGTQQIQVETTDLNFKIGVWYYITLVSQNGRGQGQLRITQNREVNALYSGTPMKAVFWTATENAKFYYIRAPQGDYRMTINITSLTEGFYPMICMNQSINRDEPALIEFSQFNYSTVVNYSIRFGDIFNSSDLLQSSSFQYSFVSAAYTSFTYWLITVYSYSYGFTDQTKAEFEMWVNLEPGVTSMNYPPQYQASFPLQQAKSLSFDQSYQKTSYNERDLDIIQITQ